MSEDKINPVDIKSPYEGKPAKPKVPSLFISCKEVDYRKVMAEINEKEALLTEQIKAAASSSDRRELSAELNELLIYKNGVTFISNGTYTVHDLLGMFSDMNEWTQALELNGKVIGNIPKKVSAKKDDEGRVTGTKNVIAAFSKEAGVGTPVNVTLPDSMFNVTIGNVTSKSIMSLMIHLNSIKNEIGFAHKGSMFCAVDAKIVCAVVEFCLDHVVSSSLVDSSKTGLMEAFVPTDAMALAAGTLKSIYPNGYPFLHACINEEDCTFKTYTPETIGTDQVPHLDYGRMTWYNERKFDQARHRFLSAPVGSHSLAAVKEMQERYNEEVTIGPFNDTGSIVRMKIKKPSYLDYRRISFDWLADIVSSVDDAMNKAASESNITIAKRQRVDDINNAIATLNIQKEAPWITEVSMTNSDGDVIKAAGTEDVLAALLTLCENEEVTANFRKIFIRAKNSLTSSMTGTPIFECPECGTINDAKDEDGNPYKIIPRNVIADFFYITELKRLV